jgi:hypothetical protein
MSVDQRTAALKKVWWIERDSIGLAMVSDADTSTDYISVNEVKTVTIHAVKLDEDFVASGTGITMTESPAIPAEFHDALAKYAIAKGYELNPATLQSAQYFNNEWEMCIREGKKYANKGRDGSGYHIRQYDY